MKRSFLVCLAAFLLLLTSSALAENDWQDAYHDFIVDEGYKSSGQDYNYDEAPSFALHDMDGDGTPELLAYNGAGYHAAGCVYAYTADNGEAKFAGNAGGDIYSDGLYYYDNDQYPGLVTIGGGMGYYNSYYETIENGQLVWEQVAYFGEDYNVDTGETKPFNQKKTTDNDLYNLTQSETDRHGVMFTDAASLDWDKFIAPWASQEAPVAPATAAPTPAAPTEAPAPAEPTVAPTVAPMPVAPTEAPTEEPPQIHSISLVLSSSEIYPSETVIATGSAPGAAYLELYMSGKEIASVRSNSVSASITYDQAEKMNRTPLIVALFAYYNDGSNASTVCKLTVMPKEELLPFRGEVYLKAFKEAKELYGNPMADNREGGFVERLMQYYEDCGLTWEERRQVMLTLYDADPVYRDLYLYGLMNYELACGLRPKKDSICQYDGVLNVLSMYTNITSEEFSSTFFHESGHATQLNLWDWNTANKNDYLYWDKVMESSPLYEQEAAIEELLYQDVKSYIARKLEPGGLGTLSLMRISETLIQYELRELPKTAEKEEIEERITAAFSNIRESIYYDPAYVSEDGIEQRYMSILAIYQNDTITEKYNSILEDYKSLTGKDFYINYDGSMPEAVKQALVEGLQYALVDSKEYANFKLLSNYNSFSTINSEIINEFSFEQDIMKEQMEPGTYNSSMVSDVYGGITNNKLIGSFGHAGDSSSEPYYYWHNEVRYPTHRQLKEAWAEYFSAKICGDEYNIEMNAQYFPLATEAFDKYAKELLAYYEDFYD